MSIVDAIEFANENPVTWLATTLNGMPQVRGMWMWFADESGFYFHTGTMKSLHDQLVLNPFVQAAFHNPGEGPGHSRMLRVSGKIEFVEDPALEKRLFEERVWLNDVKAAYPNDQIRIFRISSGEAVFWDMSCNCREKDQSRHAF